MKLASVHSRLVIPRLGALLCGVFMLACSSDDALPTSSSPAPLDARPAATPTIGPAIPLPIPSECPSAIPVDVNERGVIVGWADAPCFGVTNSQAFRLYPDGTWDSLPEPNGQRVSPLSIGRRGDVYALVPDPDVNGHWLAVTIDEAGRLTWLPFPDDGSNYNVVGRPNDHGTFVLGGDASRYYLWNGRGQLQPLPMPPAGQRFRASGLNDHEEVVGTMFTDDTRYAATWSRRAGYTLLPLASSSLYGSMGDLVDDHGRVYGQTLVGVQDTSCPYWSAGMFAQAPTVWNGRDTARVLTSDQLRCRTNVLWQEATDGKFAVGTLVGDAPDAPLAPTFAFVASPDGGLALAPCPAGWSCMGAGIDRQGTLVGHMIRDDRSAFRALTWSVSTKP